MKTSFLTQESITLNRNLVWINEQHNKMKQKDESLLCLFNLKYHSSSF
jgi:hypothetical protein